MAEEAKEALQIAIIAEEEHRWNDALEAYQKVIQINYEMGDIERAKAFEEKLNEITRNLKKKFL